MGSAKLQCTRHINTNPQRQHLLYHFCCLRYFLKILTLAISFHLIFELHDIHKKMSEEKKISEEKKMSREKKMSEEKVVDHFLARFYESMAKTNIEKITKEIMADLSEDSDDSDNYDVESGDEDSEDRPWRPSHTIFGKSTIKQSQIDAMKGRYFHDMSIMRVGGDSTAPAPEENEVVVYRSFMKAGLRFLFSKFLVEVLKIFQIFLHQITPEVIIRMGFCLGCEKPRAGTEHEVFLQYARTVVRDEGH
jgi:hypothetical protein